MKISANQLIAVFPQSKKTAAMYAELFNELLDQYGINTEARVSHFVSQVGHESLGFTRLVENLNYSAQGLASTWKNRYSTGKIILVKGKKMPEPNALALSLHRKPEAIANNTYANRLGNGNEASGDGWRYRGRGLIMITGLNNYKMCAKRTGLDLVNHPELLEIPRNALLASLEYWKENNLNAYANGVTEDDVEIVSEKINGGTIGLDERKEAFKRAIAVF
jgi:putative chitinase